MDQLVTIAEGEKTASLYENDNAGGESNEK